MNAKELILKLNEKSRYKEIWLKHTSGSSVCALINGDIGWLMYLRYDGDAGFSSRNPDELSETEIAFLLCNGQQDFYPKNWTYPVKVLKVAMISFLNIGQRPPQLAWQDDSS